MYKTHSIFSQQLCFILKISMQLTAVLEFKNTVLEYIYYSTYIIIYFLSTQTQPKILERAKQSYDIR